MSTLSYVGEREFDTHAVLEGSVGWIWCSPVSLLASNQLWGVLLRRWIYTHAGALPDVVELFVNPECLGLSVEIFVAVFRAGEAAADRQWSSVCGHRSLR
jgi:hypothetical protein